MKDRLRNIREISANAVLVLAILTCGILFVARSSAGYSNNPRQTGEAVLDEILMGSGQFIIHTASNGGTDKNSFQVGIHKEERLSSPTPHYQLTIMRIKPDECKAIVDGGVLIRFDLEKDLGLKGDFTYSITNKVEALSQSQSPDQSLGAMIEKYFSIDR